MTAFTSYQQDIHYLCSSKECTGCHACYNICANQCISMQEDREGFLMPVIDRDSCIGCRQCEKICPILYRPKLVRNEPPNIFAFVLDNPEVLSESSSGGAFSAFAELAFEKNGIVFGAAFDKNFHVRHIGVSAWADLAPIRKSKYVQSEIGKTFQEVKCYLDEKRFVLFAGTPCQIAGLYNFLGHRSNDENLLTIDLVCHGVPSPMILKKHIAYLEQEHGSKLVSIKFRHKKRRWGIVSPIYKFANNQEVEYPIFADLFFHAYGLSMILRRCCTQCRYKEKKRIADISIGDFWGLAQSSEITAQMLKRGISLVTVNSTKGSQFLEAITARHFVLKRTYEESLRFGTGCLVATAKQSPHREQFFEEINHGESFELVSKKYLPPCYLRHVCLRVFGIENYHRITYLVHLIKYFLGGKVTGW